jgi:hypothetical protein
MMSDVVLPSKRTFERYERLRCEGKRNMFEYCAFDFGLREVMRHYDALCVLYPDVRGKFLSEEKKKRRSDEK